MIVRAVSSKCIGLLAIFFLSHIYTYSQKYHFSIEYITKNDGLSNTEITSIVQDKHGFIWIGTQNGLNKFDGYSVKVYQNIPDDSTSLSDNSITALHVDSKGDLWIGTENNGISVYDRNTDRFVTYTHDRFNANTLSTQYVTSIKEDNNGNIWVGTLMGINKYQRKTKDFRRYLRKTKIIVEEATLDSLRLKHTSAKVLDYLERKRGIKIDYEQFCHDIHSAFPHLPLPYLDQILNFSRVEHTGVNVKAIEIDGQNNIWIGFENDSIAKYDPLNNILKTFAIESGKMKSSGTIKILSLCWSDESLWIGTKGGGIIRYNHKIKTFRPYKICDTKFIKCIMRDSRGDIWMGNEEGLSLYDRKSDSFRDFDYRDEFDEKLLSADVSSIFEDRDGNFWVASYQGGLNLLKKNRSFDYYKFHNEIISPTGSKSVSSVLEDSEGNLWIGYFTSGIDLFPKDTNEKKSFNRENSALGKVVRLTMS